MSRRVNLNNTLDNRSIGVRIRNIRLQLGLSMEEFGKKFDPIANKSLISKWEHGKSLPNTSRIQRIAELGNVSIDFLLYGNETILTNEHYEPLKQISHFFGFSEESPKKKIDNKVTQFLSSFFVSEDFLSEDEKILISAYRSLNKKGRTKSLNQIEDLTKIIDYQKD